jgi:hypothetical protein
MGKTGDGMMFRSTTRIALWLAAAVFALALSSCGGGGSTTTGPGGGNLDNNDNNVPPIDPDGGTVYNGKPGPTPPPGGDPVEPAKPIFGPFDFGGEIFNIPTDTNGVGRVTADTFSPGQQVAFVAINLNNAYWDAHAEGNGRFPTIPAANYSVQADLVVKGGSSVPTSSPRPAGVEDLGSQYYSGLISSSSPSGLYERESQAWGIEPYSVEDGIKSVSAIQKGEIRTFPNVQPRGGSKTVDPGPDDPTKDTTDLRYPYPYDSQDGRLVALGAHCLVFLSTEINDGHPDQVQFTQARLNRLAKEFDTVIYPGDTAAFGPVESYAEASLFKDLNRSIVLTGDDFGNDGVVNVEMPFTQDTQLATEEKLLIFISNGDAGGFFAFGPGVDEDDIEKVVGSTIYIGSDNFPPNDSVWDAAFSVMAHEFQHKLYHDHDIKPDRNTSYNWFNEGLSMLAIHLCGYSVNSGKIIPWAIDGQLTEYLNNCNQAAVPMDANPYFSNQAQYGSGFLFFLYMYEHYDAGIGKRIYAASKAGIVDTREMIKAGARTTAHGVGPDLLPGTNDDNPDLYGPDDLPGTDDDEESVTNDTYAQVYAKWCIANFIDGIYKGNESQLFDPRFIYQTIDLRGTVNLATGTIHLPGVRTTVFPQNATYPVISDDRLVIPWAADYLVFGNGSGQDLEVTFTADSNFKIFMLPVAYNQATNQVDINENVTLGY